MKIFAVFKTSKFEAPFDETSSVKKPLKKITLRPFSSCPALGRAFVGAGLLFLCGLTSPGNSFAAAVSSNKCSQSSANRSENTLNILLVGASGMIGSRVLAEAASRGHCVVAAARHPGKIATGINIFPLKLDATNRDELTDAARNVDVLVSATSPRSGDDATKEALTVAEAMVAAAKSTGKRLMVVGGAGSLVLPDGRLLLETLPAGYGREAHAMKAVLDLLKTSDIDWTFFSPAPGISPGVRTGQYRLGTKKLLTNEKGESKISVEDYAKALVDELENRQYLRSQMTISY